MSTKKLIIILGPTASGKTKFAVILAKIFNGAIISADSRQVYKHMNIGTGKDLTDYDNIPYHLIDICNPSEQFSLAEFQKKAYQAINKVISQDKTPLLVGGTGLYLQSIIEGWVLPRVKSNLALRKKLEQKTLAQLQIQAKKYNLNQSDFKNKRRLIRAIEIHQAEVKLNFKKQPKYDCLILGLKLPKAELDKKIDQRLTQRLKQGMVQEIKKLSQKISWAKLESFGLEYKWIALYLQNKIGYAEMENKLAIAIHQFAKRQLTWFRKMERQGIKIHWNKTIPQAKKLIKEFYNK